MSKRMENYLDYAEGLAPDVDPDSIEYEPKRYLLTWIPGDQTSMQTLKTFDTLDDLKKHMESIYNPWLIPKKIINLDTSKEVVWALGIDDISVPGKILFNWGFEE